VLANVYLHYALDLWAEKSVIPKLKGWARYVRYADDFLMVFQYEEDAVNVMKVLPERLGKFNFEVASDKTRVLPFGRNDQGNNSFDFLGFTFYEAKTRKGGYRVGVRTSRKKLKQKREAIKKWAKEHMHNPIDATPEASKSEAERALPVLRSKRKLSGSPEFLLLCRVYYVQSSQTS